MNIPAKPRFNHGLFASRLNPVAPAITDAKIPKIVNVRKNGVAIRICVIRVRAVGAVVAAPVVLPVRGKKGAVPVVKVNLLAPAGA